MPYGDDSHAQAYRSKILARLGGTLSQGFINAWHLDTLGFFGLWNFFGPSSQWGVTPPPPPPFPDPEGTTYQNLNNSQRPAREEPAV